MPSRTPKQRRFMAANCYGSGKGRISKKVACEFAHADAGKRPKAKRKRKG